MVCVATEYGEQVMEPSDYAQVRTGRLDRGQMQELFAKEGAELIVDATHPYAVEVTANICGAAQASGVQYVRVVREDTNGYVSIDHACGDGTSAAEAVLQNHSNETEKAVPRMDAEQGIAVSENESDRKLWSSSWENLSGIFVLEKAGDNKDSKDCTTTSEAFYYDSIDDCICALADTDGTILLTTGSKELARFAESETLRKRLFARVLPSIESIQLCLDAGLRGKQIIAVQGPFTKNYNAALLRQYDIRHLVTKESGRAGGFAEKCQAALECGCRLHIIGRPAVEQGISVEQAIWEAEKVLNSSSSDAAEKVVHKEECFVVGDESLQVVTKEELNNRVSDKEKKNANEVQVPEQSAFMEIALIGIGMGNLDSLIIEAYCTIEQADILFGAERMLEFARTHFQTDNKQLYPYYLAKQIIPCLEEQLKKKETIRAAILFSGDRGLYSGAARMGQALKQWSSEQGVHCRIRQLCGISSVAYFAAQIGEMYSDAAIESLHGWSGSRSREQQVIETIRTNERCFLLLSGAADVRRLGELLTEAGLGSCSIRLGYQLSYPEQQIYTLTCEECGEITEEGLYIACISNPCSEQNRPLMPTLPDSAFIRGKVPMTKSAIRTLSVSRLHLRPDSVVYDIGSGTGSVSVEIAGCSERISVYAIERKPEAVVLTRENASKHHRSNIMVIEGLAPDAFAKLPAPTHAFIGGSGGRLRDIIEALRAKNPQVRIVINAISLETISEITELMRELDVTDEEILQVQVSEARKVGGYHLMEAQNPVMIASFTLR